MTRGRLITIEGLDGAGKTTLASSLESKLRERGIDVRLLREPGGVQASERIRELVKDPNLVVGSRAPVTVPLYAVPPLLAVRIPAIRPYRYALVADRVFLVDPTGIVVEELAP